MKSLPDDSIGTAMAYVAGLFEGEGSVSLNKRSHSRGYPIASITMTDKEPLERVTECLGAGNITGPYRPPSHQAHFKSQWIWSLCGWDAVESLFEATVGLLSPRRVVQFEDVLKGAPPVHERGWAWHHRNLTHCKRGHLFDPANTGRDGRGHRYCRICARARERRRRATA